MVPLLEQFGSLGRQGTKRDRVRAAAAMPGMSVAGTIAMFTGVETTDLAVAYLTSRSRELGFFVLCVSSVALFELPSLQTSRCHEFLNSTPLPI